MAEADAAPDPACVVQDIVRGDGLIVWSPTGAQYIVNKKDEEGTYQLYVGGTSGSTPDCITCVERPNSPALDRHKLQPRWHPSGEWIVLAGEREKYDKPVISTPQMIEGWVQSGLWVNIYATRPDGSEWHKLSDFGGKQRGDGFTGPAFTPDGGQAVWAQIVDGNIFVNLFGRWELILADFREDSDGVPSFENLRDITPRGARWVEPGNFSPDGKSLLITADIGMADPQGMDQFILDITTGSTRNLTGSPKLWDEHGVFSPDGEKILFMSSYPFRANPNQHNTLFLKTLPAGSAERAAGLKAVSDKYGPQSAIPDDKYEAYLDEVEALNKKFPAPQADFEDYMKQILYAIKTVGVDHVGLGGADWDGGGGLTGYRDITDMPKVTARLLKEGYTEADLAKMWGGNVLRVLKAAEDYAASLKK